jgi:Kdo2-lipid IVA lauroyltransferase/acyltransferase
MKQRPIRHRIEYGLYLAFRTFLRALPHAATRTVGHGLGNFAHAIDRRHREIARRNMELALPALGAAERDRLVRDCFRHFGAALCDAVSSSRFDGVEICRRFTLEGWQHMEEAESLGRGLFFLTAHLGFWELAPPVLGLYRGSVGIVVRPADNPWLDRELTALRERFGNATFPKRGAARKMLETVRKRGRVGILIDQRVQAKEGIETTFFGHPALTSPILARMSLRTGAPVVPVTIYPAPKGRYHLVARPAIHPPEGAEDDEPSVAALTQRYLAVAEDDIRANPAMWLWMHRRWDRVG